MPDFAAARQPTSEPQGRHSATPASPISAQPENGRALDGDLRASMETRFAHDFSRVRIHSGPESADRARAHDAIAYTVGSDIVLSPAHYRPGTGAGRALLAHELAHVVQQDGHPPTSPPKGVSAPGDAAEQAADAAAHAFGGQTEPEGSLALNLRESLRATRTQAPMVLRAVATWAGDFDTDKYVTVLDAAKKNSIGVDIELRFKPGKHVNAERIGMVQMVTSKDKGKVLAVNATVGARSIAAGAGEGAHIDQLKQFRSPMYATGAAGAKDQLADTPTQKQWGQHGWRFTDKAGKVQKRDALLKDTPQLPAHGANASQVFESTAVAIKGTQVGTWYGSVQWGWTSDAANKFTKLPLSLVSKDVPSGTFATAAGLWAAKPTSTGGATIALPMIMGKFTNTPGVWLVGNPAKSASTIIGKLAKNTRLEVTDKGVAMAFNKGAKAQWWKVTIVGGGFVGRVGWVMESMLADVAK